MAEQMDDILGQMREAVRIERDADAVLVPIAHLRAVPERLDAPAPVDQGDREALSDRVMAAGYVGAWNEYVRERGDDLPDDAEERFAAAWFAAQPKTVTAKEDADGLLPIEQKIADRLFEKWPDELCQALYIYEDPRTVARWLRPVLIDALNITVEGGAE